MSPTLITNTYINITLMFRFLNIVFGNPENTGKKKKRTLYKSILIIASRSIQKVSSEQ